MWALGWELITRKTKPWLEAWNFQPLSSFSKVGRRTGIRVPNWSWLCDVQFSSVTQSCPTLCNPMDCSTPGIPIHHQLPELMQTHVHWVGDAIQPSHPLSSPSPRAFNLSLHQGLFKWVSSSLRWPKFWRFSLLINYFGCSVQPLSHVRLFVTPWTVARQASLSITNSWSLLKLMSIESVLPSNHLILCPPLLLLSSIFPSIRVFSNESVLHIKWPTIGVSALASVLPMNIQNWFLRIDWLDLLAVQGTLKSLLQHHSSKAKSNLSILCQRTKD